MESLNIGPIKTWLAMSVIAFALSGCGAPEDGASAPEAKATAVVQPEEVALTGGLGEAASNVESRGYGTGPGSAGSETVYSAKANFRSAVKPKRASGGVVIIKGMAKPKPKRASSVAIVSPSPAASSNEVSDEFASLLAEVDRKLASLPSANIAFNTPETIPYGESAVIELLVSLQEAEEELRQAIRAAGPIETAKVKVSPYLEASLSGIGFSIEPVTPPRQLLSPSQRTQWRWNIEPTKAASLELTLTLSALFTVDGQQSTRAIQTFERTITVDVPITHRVTDLVIANKELLFTLLIIPAAGWLYRRYRSKTPSDDKPGRFPGSF